MQFRTASRTCLCAAGLAILIAAGPAFAAVAFRYALDDSPLDVSKPIKGETFTNAVIAFHETGVNSYSNDAAALITGKEKFAELCAACHNPDASGHMGPSLIDGDVTNSRANTDIGKFEIIYAGASGAMRSFADRGVTQDEILKIIAFLNTLKK